MFFDTGGVYDVSGLSMMDAMRAEGDAGSGSMSFNVNLSVPSSSTVTVRYRTINDQAVAGSDYTSTSGTLTFPPGVTRQTINVPVIRDRAVEPNESFFVVLSNPQNTTLDPKSFGVGTIVNDDGVGLPRISISDAAVAEHNAGSTIATFTVQLSRPSTSVVSVRYATADGTATTADADYVAQSGTLMFAPGTTEKTIRVTVNGDTNVEPNETLQVRLSAPRSAAILDGTGVGTIVNDEP